MQAGPLIGFGEVRHARLRPQKNSFVYPTFFLMLPMRLLRRQPANAGALAWNRAGILAFRDEDHGDGRSVEQGGALAWLEGLLHEAGITDAQGEIWLQCYPRVFGYSFKPVSFWFCHRTDNSLRAIVAEVNNTFGERHAYLLDEAAYGRELLASKHFHVSPFCPVEGGYRFEFERTTQHGQERVRARVDFYDTQGPVVLTGLAGDLEALTPKARRRALLHYPLMTLAVIARIHWQALRLWRKRVPFHSKPAPPVEAVSHSSPHGR